MSFSLDPKQQEYFEQLRGWAAEHLYPGVEERYARRAIPRETWALLANRGLTAAFRQPDAPLLFALSGEALVAGSRDLGLGLSWLVSQLLCRDYVAPHHRAQPQASLGALLDRVADEGAVLALLLSEAEGGAHPKYLKATATRCGEGWSLSGEKLFSTNGPQADAYLFLAKTRSGDDGKHEFSAFVVAGDAEGIEREAMELPFCQSSPHGIVRFDQVRAPAEALVGAEGDAYERVIRPFRQLEDSFIMGLFVGHLSWLLEALVEALEPELHDVEVGTALGQIHAARLASYATAYARHRNGVGDPQEVLCRNAAQVSLKSAQQTLKGLLDALPKEHRSPDLSRGFNDLQLGKVGGGVRKQLRARFARQHFPADR